MDLIRSMIERVELRPRAEARSLDAVLHGDLAAIRFSESVGEQPKTKTPWILRSRGVRCRWLRGQDLNL